MAPFPEPFQEPWPFTLYPLSNHGALPRTLLVAMAPYPFSNHGALICTLSVTMALFPVVTTTRRHCLNYPGGKPINAESIMTRIGRGAPGFQLVIY